MAVEDTLVEVAQVKQAVLAVKSPKEYHSKAFRVMSKFSMLINEK